MDNVMHHIGKETKSLGDRGLPDHSHFELHIGDDVAKEHTTNWSDLSELREVTKAGQPFSAHVCRHNATSITVYHSGLETTIDIPEGYEVYQAVQSTFAFLSGGKSSNVITGRIVGLIKDGEVVEERFLSEAENRVIGFKL